MSEKLPDKDRFPYVGESPLGFVYDVINDLHVLFERYKAPGKLELHCTQEKTTIIIIVDWRSDTLGKCQYGVSIELRPLYLFGNNLTTMRKDIADAFERKLKQALPTP